MKKKKTNKGKKTDQNNWGNPQKNCLQVFIKIKEFRSQRSHAIIGKPPNNINNNNIPVLNQTPKNVRN